MDKFEGKTPDLENKPMSSNSKDTLNIIEPSKIPVDPAIAEVRSMSSPLKTGAKC